ncbi:unnamed protein product [Brassicogethes aeneus]|uniref:Uncharacterized protein n=1 Tax=Brassicogethes aeneus TaxID=1431903 RepID=A0A9P0FLB1_BRAAE|nr:unnamed protein product [Brassicogethes aeneus]
MAVIIYESAEICIDKVRVFWQKAQIPTKRKDHCIYQLLKLYEQYQLLQKSVNRESNKIKEDEFKSLLLNLFDIAHANATLIINKDTQNFLTQQRKDGRVGYIANIESDDNEEAQRIKDELLQLRQEKSERIDDKLVAVFDHCKLSDPNAVLLTVALCSSINIDANPLIVNRSSIRRIREKLREEKVKQIKGLFKYEDLNASVLHWDGNFFKTSTGETKERLPVVLICVKIEKILAIPVLDDGTGQSQADAMFDVIVDWGISNCIKVLCCDTTPANLGPNKGAAVILEQLLEENLLYLPCRHHMFELVLKDVFELKIPGTGKKISR